MYLTQLDNGTFTGKIFLFGFIPIKYKNNAFFVDSISGHEVLIQKNLLNQKRELLAEKIEPQIISENWKSRLGKYEIANADKNDLPAGSDYELLVSNQFITLKYKSLLVEQTIEVPLYIINDKQAYVLGIGRNAGDNLQISRNKKGEEVIKIYGYELKKMINSDLSQLKNISKVQ